MIIVSNKEQHKRLLQQQQDYQRQIDEAAEKGKEDAFILVDKLKEMADRHNTLVDRVEHLEQELPHHKMEEHKGHD